MTKTNLKLKLGKNSVTSLFFILACTWFGFAQEITVRGTVTSSTDNMPLPGASVFIIGTNTGVTTDFDGNFELSAPPEASLRVSYIGFTAQTISINNRTVIDVALSEDVDVLDEVVVIGYGTQKKALVTGANIQVGGEQLQKQSTTNALQALQGQTPGVQITSTSGQPGSGLNVVIRGLGSTGGNAPLYVVDGVLTGDISYLNNSDIESISILKDAASAAIYGSQASNGVVLVTTKGGKKGDLQMTFDQYYGVQKVANKIDMLNAREYASILNEAAVNSGKLPYFSNSDINAMGSGTDWMGAMFKDNAVTQNYTLGVSGGSENSVFSSSLSYTSEEGIVGGRDLSNYERYNFRINSEHKLYDGRVTFGENLSFAYIKNNGVGVGNQYNNSLRGAFNTNPLVPFYDENGNYYNTSDDSEGWLAGQSNPYASMVYGNQNRNNSQKLVGNVYLEFELLKNLKFRTSLGIDYTANEGHAFSPIYQLSVYNFNNYTTASQSTSKGHSLLWDNLLTYKFSIAENHNFEAMVGTSSFKYEDNYMYGSNVNLVFDDLKRAWLDNALNTDGAQITLNGGPRNINKRMSYFGRLNYTYKDKYLLNATFRADGSSQFHQDNRWGYFPSVSAGWVVTEEEFLGNTNWLDFFKLRGSWGQVGNQNAGNFQYLSPVTFANTNYIFGNEEGVLSPGAYPSRYANPDLKWEASEQIDIGFDARLFRNSLTVNFDWYKKTNKDWLIKPPILATAGADAPWINGGDVVNKGVELALSYRGNINALNFTVGVNGAYNKNSVGNIPTEDGIIHGETNQLFDNSSEFYRAQSGYPLGYFWGLETAGIFQTEQDVLNHTSNGTVIQPSAQPGDVIYVDQNGDGVINDMDKINIGDPNPDLNFGFNIALDYKAFDFSLQANGVAGNQIVQSYRNQSSQYANYTTAILDRWHGPGSSNSVPRVTEDNRNWVNFSDLYVQDGDFLRISNVTVGFDIAKLKLKKKFFASQFRVYASVLNLYTFTNYNGMDPEIGYGISNDDYNFSSGVDLGYYPRPRTFMMGLNVKF
ncbi:TonB-dependent receptor [Sinomicrobium pectinilyticum]|uniref:TonB-dependent receptor n=1 Tax=Sinomicrobium pectinilyticum TaxID=1084421 RepID=A0A3N0E8C9_SINP1|nr:TonB-dependent receptor [Sinomicrobium pectinilyticum]RNL84107.1 TonB-dependent receptor [Sinomicrobium pectinilyticum]